MSQLLRGVQQLKLRLRTNKAVVRRVLGKANQRLPLGHPTSKPLLESLDCTGRVILQNMPFSAAIQGYVRRMMIVMSCKSSKVRTYVVFFGGVSYFYPFMFACFKVRLMSFVMFGSLSLKVVYLLIH